MPYTIPTELTAVAKRGFHFTGWSGSCTTKTYAVQRQLDDGFNAYRHVRVHASREASLNRLASWVPGAALARLMLCVSVRVCGGHAR
jgi:hypothetical protein